MTWANSAGKDRRLVFVAYGESGPVGSDRWYPLVDGGFTEVQEEARRVAGISRRRVLIIALSIDARFPTGIGEKALLRLGQPWY